MFILLGVPCDTTDRGNGTLYLCKNRRCVYKDLLCHHLNPCGDFYDFCPDTSVEPEEGSVPIMVPVLIIVSTMIVLFFLCQGFLMIRNRKCPCRHHGYSNELVRTSSVTQAWTFPIHCIQLILYLSSTYHLFDLDTLVPSLLSAYTRMQPLNYQFSNIF